MNNLEMDNHTVKIDNFLINTVGRRISINGRSVILTGKEFDLFYLLITNQVSITRERYWKLWGYDYYGI